MDLIGPRRLMALLIFALLISACAGSAGQFLEEGDQAPAFELPTAQGGDVSLTQYKGSSPVLLYFHMAVG